LPLLVAAFLMKEATQKPTFIGGRMRVAREFLGFSQQGLADELGVSKRGIQDNETRNRVPGGDVINGFVYLGINANWLLTGDGPMLLADLAPKPVQINVKALSAIIEGLAKAGASPEKLGSTAVRYYQDAIAQGLITSTSVGEGDSNIVA
jgi:transcriptional regulator with XRE-family HTH domain